MIDDAAFLQAIRESPDDSARRLVYADWLDDRGNSAAAAQQRVRADPTNDEWRLALAAVFEAEGDWGRAELIRTQLAISGLPRGDVRLYCADRRVQQVIENNLPAWDTDLPAWARQVCDEARRQSYRRGLPAVVHCDAADWLDQGAELLERQAIEEVVFSWYTLQPRLDDWLRSPLTGRVKRFGLSGQYLTDADLRKIAASPALAHVESLDLAHNSYGDDGVCALAASSNLSNLRELDLYVSRVGPKGFRAITQSGRLPYLRCLEVGHNHCAVGDEDMRGLAESPHRYEQLTLYGTAVTDAGVETLCRAKCAAGLRQLSLGGNALTAAAAEALAGSATFSQLEYLDLTNTQIGDQGAAALAHSTTLSRLCHLQLLRAQIGLRGGQEMGRAPHLRAVAHLDLRYNSCGSTLLTALAESRAFPGLLDLRLNSTSVTSAALGALAESRILGGIMRLDLGNNEIDDHGVTVLARNGGMENLRVLILNANRISSPGAQALAGAMPPHIAVLILSDNRIEDSGALAFQSRVPARCNLVLHGNPISDDVWQTLETSLGDQFAFEYADDLLSIPQRGRNRPPVAARTDREPVSNTLVPSTPDLRVVATGATDTGSVNQE